MMISHWKVMMAGSGTCTWVKRCVYMCLSEERKSGKGGRGRGDRERGREREREREREGKRERESQ